MPCSYAAEYESANCKLDRPQSKHIDGKVTRRKFPLLLITAFLYWTASAKPIIHGFVPEPPSCSNNNSMVTAPVFTVLKLRSLPACRSDRVTYWQTRGARLGFP